MATFMWTELSVFVATFLRERLVGPLPCWLVCGGWRVGVRCAEFIFGQLFFGEYFLVDLNMSGILFGGCSYAFGGTQGRIGFHPGRKADFSETMQRVVALQRWHELDYRMVVLSCVCCA